MSEGDNYHLTDEHGYHLNRTTPDISPMVQANLAKEEKWLSSQSNKSFRSTEFMALWYVLGVVVFAGIVIVLVVLYGKYAEHMGSDLYNEAHVERGVVRSKPSNASTLLTSMSVENLGSFLFNPSSCTSLHSASQSHARIEQREKNSLLASITAYSPHLLQKRGLDSPQHHRRSSMVQYPQCTLDTITEDSNSSRNSSIVISVTKSITT